ncbi:MAG TPA: nucleotidyltransferase family protein [Polyangiaceae bacterium]|jgi:CTP:molybdopterin cytidylyltransferase MocA
MTAQVGCAILAAGASRRLGQPKQLLLHRGQPLVRWAAQCVWQSKAARCAVVVGAQADAVRAALGALSLELIDNKEWQEGIASSIRAAVAWARDARCAALLLTLCDQPRLSSAHLDRLLLEHEWCGLAVGSGYGGKQGVPALFPQAYFEALGALRGDSGASALLNGEEPVASVPWPDGELDVDTPDAARHLLRAADYDLP